MLTVTLSATGLVLVVAIVALLMFFTGLSAWKRGEAKGLKEGAELGLKEGMSAVLHHLGVDEPAIENVKRVITEQCRKRLG